MRYTYRGMKIRIYLHPWTGPSTYYYETDVKSDVGFPTQAAALDAAKAAIDEHLEKEAAKT